MGKFLRNIGLVIVPFLAVWMVVWFSIDAPRFYVYHFTKNQGCNIESIYYRLYENKTPIQAAFLGASHTGCGVNDLLIDSVLQTGGEVVNLSYCGGNRNIHKLVLQDLINTHKPKVVFLDVVMNEPVGSHRDFGVLATQNQVLKAPVFFNSKYMNDVYKNMELNFFYTQDRLFDVLPQPISRDEYPNYIFSDVFKLKADSNQLRAFEKRHKQDLVKNQAGGFVIEHEQQVSLEYIREFAELCEDNDIRLVFLYIPAFGMVSPEPIHAKQYREWGELWIPPSSIFKTPSNWVDNEHLNTWGARDLSLWIATEMQKKKMLN